MQMPKWTQEFLATTKGRIVSLMRGAGRTVNDLADALGLTDNAVRAQLTALERDGLVRKRGVRPGFRKPHQEYELTLEAEHLFPKPYAPVLSELLATLKGRLPPEAVQGLLRDVGRRLAAGRPVRAGRESTLEERVQAAATVLAELGGLPGVERLDGGFIIRSASCPLGAVSAVHPDVCQLGQELVAQIVGVPVRARCQHGPAPAPQCRFEIQAEER
ncbi:MAG: helix-turn-helix domain-containing protein [Verrucomicrobia bacterium]|nr:helix-turn-helix domain-containing protein [Verrucomicrobiota bacterium]